MSKPRLSNQDYCRGAKRLRCLPAAIKSVAEVESAGDGFLPDGRVKILFERHHFARLTQHRFDVQYPQISNRDPGGYYGGASEYQRFNLAFQLDAEAAMQSASWGKFQIMGFNHSIVGFHSVGDFVDAMRESEGKQLDAFLEFALANHLDDDLRRLDWAGFARGYNGRSYTRNHYDQKMASAYNKYKTVDFNCDAVISNQIEDTSFGQPSTESVVIPPPIPQTATPSPAMTTTTPAQDDAATNTSSVAQPDQPKEVSAPAKDDSTSTVVKTSIFGIAVPGFVAVVIKAVTDAISQGFISAAQIGEFVLNLVKDNQKYVIWLVIAFVAMLGLKKILKSITLWFQMYIMGRKDMNDVVVKQG